MHAKHRRRCGLDKSSRSLAVSDLSKSQEPLVFEVVDVDFVTFDFSKKRVFWNVRFGNGFVDTALVGAKS